MAHTHHQSDHVHHPKPSGKIGSDRAEKKMMHRDKHTGHSLQDFLKRFWICSVLTLPVIFLSHHIQEWIGIKTHIPGQTYIVAIFACIVYVYGGYPFLKGTTDELKNRSIGMMTLIGIAITVSWAYSLAVTFGLKGMDFFWEMATLIDVMLIGHFFEMRSVQRASRSLELLVKLLPSSAQVINNNKTNEVPIEDLKMNDLIMIKPGEKVPVDGTVVLGESYLDESMLTGESIPVQKEKNSKVIGGSVNGTGTLTIKVTGTGKDSYLQKIITMVSEAQSSKSRSEAFADKAAKILTYVALIGGFLTLAIWLSLGFSFSTAMERMVTVMVISCPHALGLAIPLVAAISTNQAAAHGLLIKNRTAFENSRLITTVLFDKTGTLTEGTHQLNKIEILDKGINETELLKLAAAIERHSEHFIAKGILNEAKKLNIETPEAESFKYIPGEGVEGKVHGKDVLLVGPNYFREHKIDLPLLSSPKGETIIYVFVESKLVGYLTFSDKIRKESKIAIDTLKNLGIRSVLITGDNEEVAKEVSKELNINEYFANVLPHEKLAEIEKLQKRGEFVAMTGDGVNDAPALAKADVGIAVGSGTDIAAESADIILVNSNPQDIARAIIFGRATYNKMKQNLWWAAGYNIIAIPLAAGVLYSWNFTLSPAIAAILMSVSTIVVALNAQVLRWKIYRITQRLKK